MSNKLFQKQFIHAKLTAYSIAFKSPMRFKQAHLTHREGLILQLTENNHCQHHIEIAPLPGFSQETLSQVKTEMLQLLSTNWQRIERHKSDFKSTQFALDCLTFNTQKTAQSDLACLDNIALLQGDNKSILKQYQILGQPKIIKLKVARSNVEDDISTFKELCQFNPALKIRCDANQGWTQQQADLFFSGIDCERLDYIEEPTRDHQINLQLADKYKIYLALDETLQQTNFYYQANPFIKAFIIKPTLIGHKHKIDQLVSRAKKDAILISFSSSFESIVGLQQLKDLANYYLTQDKDKTLDISLGIDTLKYFDGVLLKNGQQIQKDCQQLELLWTSH
jgi:O-succinylbenzoate synthase